MKKYLLLLLLSFSLLFSYAQYEQVLYQVPTISDMKIYCGPAIRLYVVSENVDYVLCSACTIDNSTTFSGAGGRIWHRVGNGSTIINNNPLASNDYVSPEQYGADNDTTTRDDAALKATVAAAGNYGAIRLKPGVTYILTAALTLLPNQTLIMYGARLKSADQIVTSTTTPITTGTSPTVITVANAAGLEVGMQITVTSGTNMRDGDYNPHTILAVNGNQLTVSVNFLKAFPNGGTVVTHHAMIDATAGNKIYGGEIDGNRLNNSGYAAWQTNYLIYTGGFQPVVRDIYLHDSQADGIMVGGINPVIESNHIYRSGGNGIHLSGVVGAKIIFNDIEYSTLGIIGTDNSTGPGHAEGSVTWSNIIFNTLIYGNTLMYARTFFGVIDGDDNNNNIISHNYCENAWLYAIEFKDGSGISVNSLKNLQFVSNKVVNGQRLYLNNNGSSNYTYGSANRSIIVANNIFEHTTIEATRAKDFLLDNNILDQSGDSSLVSIDLYSCRNYSVTNNIALYGGIGLRVNPSNDPDNIKWYVGGEGSIVHNQFRDQYQYGMQTYSDNSRQYTDLWVEDNRIRQSLTYRPNYIGIQAGNGVVYFNNKINMSCGRYGIQCAGDLVTGGSGIMGSIVRGNYIITPAGTPSVKIGGGTSNNEATGNYMSQPASISEPNSNTVNSNSTF